MHVKKKVIIISKFDFLKEKHNFPKRVIVGMRRRMQVCPHIERNGNWPRTLEIKIYFFFVLM